MTLGRKEKTDWLDVEGEAGGGNHEFQASARLTSGRGWVGGPAVSPH